MGLHPIVFPDLTGLFEADLSDPAALRRLWDTSHAVASLQGIVNRHEPRLFTRYNSEPDDFWWNLMTAEGGWLHDRTIKSVDEIEELFSYFQDSIRGVAVYDERVPATSNIASSVAGVEDLACLRYDERPDSLYRRLVEGGPRLPVKLRLLQQDGSLLFTGKGGIPGTDLPSTGSAKNDAYRWLIEKYIKTGRTNPNLVGYYIDSFWLNCYFAEEPQNHTLCNHDYVIANRGVVVDLNVWEDEAPVDEPDQIPGTDLDTLKQIFRACYDQSGGKSMIHVPGFVPWAFKYTTFQSEDWSSGGTHNEFKTEWRFTEILTSFNGYKDADALSMSSLPNASFYRHYPLPEVIPQKSPRPSRESLIEQGILDQEGRIIPRYYYAHYQGDWDAAAWIYWVMPKNWTDPQRGAVPMTWPINPNLADRFPVGMHWLRQTATENYTFVAGDSGAGYVIPNLLTNRIHSDLPSGVPAWEEHCRRYYQQWDLSATGFLIDGEAPPMTEESWDAYARFSPGGVGVQKSKVPRGVHHGMPYIRINRDLQHELEHQVETLLSHVDKEELKLIYHRSVLRPPSQYVALDQALQGEAPGKFRLVDLPTLLWLVKEYESHLESYRQFSPYHDAREVAVTPEGSDGLHVATRGNPCEAGEHDGTPVWSIKGGGRNDLYFDANDNFVGDGLSHAEIEVEYLDRGTGRTALEYDSTDKAAPRDPELGVFKEAKPLIERRGTDEWRTYTVRVDDAFFADNQNPTMDLRLRNEGDDFLVRRVSVRRRGE